MFAQANSEHCRHKIFNARFTIDGEAQPHSMFQMIRHTEQQSPQHTVVAYSDNASVMEGGEIESWRPDGFANAPRYAGKRETMHVLMKVETHNHPTAISPFPGAATGAGGEIRDEGATGRGSKPKAGLTGFSVSNLHLPGTRRALGAQSPIGRPAHIASALQIMIDGPLGGAAFNNEFGRPNLAGYFRVFEQDVAGVRRGYHKPIMIAGGLGSIAAEQTHKIAFPAGTLLIQLGGPGMRIGMGGGAASSMAAGANAAALDFDSVQRGNPEIERRAQEVINHCWALGETNPILAIHDVGAGGISNAFPELVDGAGRGARFDLSQVPLEESGLAPKEIWCNESQERYVMAVSPDALPLFEAMCKRERCPFAVVGVATDEPRLLLEQPGSDDRPIDMPMDVLLGKPPKMHREVERVARDEAALDLGDADLDKLGFDVLRHPTRGQQALPDHHRRPHRGRPEPPRPDGRPVAGAGGRLRRHAGRLPGLSRRGDEPGRTHAAGRARCAGIRAAWRSARRSPTCWPRRSSCRASSSAATGWRPAARPVKTPRCTTPSRPSASSCARRWASACRSARTACRCAPAGDDAGRRRREPGRRAPVSLIVTAFATLADVRQTLDAATARWRHDAGADRPRSGQEAHGRLDAGAGARPVRQRGGRRHSRSRRSAAAEITGRRDQPVARRRQLARLPRPQRRRRCGPRVCEMAFAGHLGVSLNVDMLVTEGDGITDSRAEYGDSKNWATQVDARRKELTLRALFNEELGVVIQVPTSVRNEVMQTLRAHGLSKHSHFIGKTNERGVIEVWRDAKSVFKAPLADLQRSLGRGQLAHRRAARQPGLRRCRARSRRPRRRPRPARRSSASTRPTTCAAPFIGGARPAVAILREQGVNSHVEMSYAMAQAGFDTFDVHMTDLQSGAARLDQFKGFIACGGFSYGDTLGAGIGWARSILFNPQLAEQFAAFFQRSDSFALGVCNGCQMMAALAPIIPGAQAWPAFTRNRSEQFEARLSMVEVLDSPSIFFAGMAGSRLPIAVAHGEGFADFSQRGDADSVQRAMRFVDHHGRPTTDYPFNPNGSPDGLTAVTTPDGRFSVLMPHPERVFRNVQMSWTSGDVSQPSPWTAHVRQRAARGRLILAGAPSGAILPGHHRA